VPLAYETLSLGGDSGAVLNAADEVMTHLFLQGQVPFPAITATVAGTVRGRMPRPVHGLDDVLRADQEGRDSAMAMVQERR
jgi:1-deoxy-D-xylulose 5-phosphate reductoisomerase